MANINYCPNCGAQLFDDIIKCEYCGHDIKRKKNKTTSQKLDDGFKDLGDSANNLVNDLTKKDFNVVIFVLLLIFAWPVAIIYLIIMQNNDKT